MNTDELLAMLVMAMEKVTFPASRTMRPNRLSNSDDYDLWESRMKTFIETIDEGSRSADILECVDDDVLTVARACNITPFSSG